VARQTGSNDPIINGIQVPQLTDIATGNYQNVITKTMDNYSQAMKALEGKAQVDQGTWATMRQKNEQYEAQVQAVNRANAESGGGGSDWGAALGNLGKSLVSGLIANEQLQEQRKQQEFNNSVTTEELNMKKQAFADKQAGEEQAAQHEQLTQMVQTRLSEIEGDVYKTIQKGSYDQGIAYAEAQVGLIMSDPLFQSLSDANKFYVSSLGQSFLTRIRKENLTQVRGEQDKIEDSTISLAQQQWTYQSVSLLKSIESGAGVLTPEKVEEGVKGLLKNAQDVITSDTSLASILSDKSKYIKYYQGILSQINGSLDKYYGEAGKWTQTTLNYQEAINKLGQLDALRNIPGQMSEGEYQKSALLVLTSLGISPDVSKIPTTQVNALRAERDRQQEIEKTNAALQRNENLRTIQEGNPNLAKAKDFVIAQAVFNTISNNNASSLNTRIADLEYHIKESPDVAQARGYAQQLELLKKYRTEQTNVLKLQTQAHKLEGDLANLDFKLNPPDIKTFIIPPGTPLGATQGERERPEAVTVHIPDSIPTASRGEVEAKARELQKTYDQITNIASYWADNGINIFDPKDTQYLKKMEADTAAARDLISKTPEYSSHQPSSQGVTSPNNQPEDSRLYKALDYEVKKNGYTDLTVNYVQHNVPEYKTRQSLILPIQERIDELDTKYQDSVRYLIKGYDGGNSTDIDELKNTLVYNKAGMSAGQIKFMDGLMEEQKAKLEKLDKFLQTKSQWYRQRWGLLDSGVPPSNFSQGSEPKPASQTPLPSNTAPLTPTMPLAGNLAKTPYGFAPFKGGTVSFTSDYRASGRFGQTPRPKHNGIDMSSTDPRVASIQGGTVVVADMSTINPTGFGNVVVVKTPDGLYELYGHLKSISVKKGDVIDPASQIGIMGSSGHSTGVHVHLGVFSQLNLSNLVGTSLDPVDYLQKVSAKVTLPRGHGASPNQGQQTTYETSNTGFYKISERLTYMNGYVLDRQTGIVRKATNTERASTSGYSPITTVSRRSNNQPSNSSYQAPSGETIVENWKIPKKAQAEKDYLFVHPTGRKAANGNDILAVEGYRNGQKVFSLEAVSGQATTAGNTNLRRQPGSGAQLPDGEYSVSRNTVPGSSAAVGGDFLPISGINSGRAALGFHYDGDNDQQTHGCIGLLSKADRDKVFQFVRSSGRQLNLYVNTREVDRQVQRASSMNTPSGNSGGSVTPTTSTHASSYPKNDPKANYGYSTLIQHPEYARALAEGADKVGIPAVWLADMIDSESSWNNIQRTDGRAAGLFQATPDTLKWLGRATIGRPMTKQEFINKGVVWQLSVAFPAYLNIIGKDAGKGYHSMGDVLAAVWGGKTSLRRSGADRVNSVYEGEGRNRVTWNMRMSKMGRRVGRSYDPQASLPAIVHDNPRDSCATCNQMLLNGHFTAHTIRGNGDIPNNYA
jgi:murein DD-endopeptidase MepM/ murein hydrolase activator NlpD